MSHSPQDIVAEMMAHDAFSQWLGIEVLGVSLGSAHLRMVVRPEMLNGFGVCHGGVTFAFADSAFAFASNGHGRVSVSIDASMSYPAPVHAGDVLEAVAEELASGGRIANYQVTVSKADGSRVGLFRGTVYRTSKSHFPDESA